MDILYEIIFAAVCAVVAAGAYFAFFYEGERCAQAPAAAGGDDGNGATRHNGARAAGKAEAGGEGRPASVSGLRQRRGNAGATEARQQQEQEEQQQQQQQQQPQQRGRSSPQGAVRGDPCGGAPAAAPSAQIARSGNGGGSGGSHGGGGGGGGGKAEAGGQVDQVDDFATTAIEVGPDLARLTDTGGADPVGREEQLAICRMLLRCAALCRAPEMRGLNKQAELCNSMLRHDGLHLLQALAEDEAGTDGQVRAAAAQLVAEVATLIWA
jgi:hypothetical protein